MEDLPYAKKSLGQHWLKDDETLEAIVRTAAVGPDDTVLEVGPGTGTLTRVLSRYAGRVIAVEYDKELYDQLSKQEIAKNLQFVRGDILRFDLTTLPPDYKLVANIPYYLTSNLIRVISESTNPPKVAVLLVQKEVAERVAAAPGDMSLLSVSAQLYWRVSLGREVPAGLFTPPPKVDSQVLILERRLEPLFADVDTKSFLRMVKAGFSNRRKTLLNSLSAGLRAGKAETEAALARAGISPKTRPQELSLPEWYELHKSMADIA